MNWDDARVFLGVARTGKMLTAAEKLGLNQATLSRRIAALEEDLGTRLIIRRPKGCELTSEGEELQASLERVESEMLLAQSRLQDQTAAVTGSVRIGAPDGLGTGFLSPRLHKLGETHPGLKIELVPMPRSFSLSQREADVAVMVGRPERGRLVARKLTDYSLGLYGSRDYLARYGTPEKLDDLAAHRLVGYVEELIYSTQLAYNREFWPDWQSHMEIASALGQMEAIRHGAGLGLLHDYLARHDENLVRVLEPHALKRSYWVAYHESLRNMLRVEEVVRFLVAEVAAVSADFVID